MLFLYINAVCNRWFTFATVDLLTYGDRRCYNISKWYKDGDENDSEKRGFNKLFNLFVIMGVFFICGSGGLLIPRWRVFITLSAKKCKGQLYFKIGEGDIS